MNPTQLQKGVEYTQGQSIIDDAGNVGTVQFDPNTGKKLTTGQKTSIGPAIVSNYNKNNQVTEGIGKLNTYGADRGMRGDGENVYYPDGTAYQPFEKVSEKGIVSTYENSPEYKELQRLRQSLDASTSSQIAGIQQQLDTRRQEVDQFSKMQQDAAKRSRIMTGQMQASPLSVQSLMSSQEKYRIKQIADLDAKEIQLINAAKIAQQEGDYQIMAKQIQLIGDIRKQKQAEVEAVNAEIAKRNNELYERAQVAERDNLISEAFSQGITSPAEILKTLNAQGANFSLKEVSDSLKSLVPEGLDDLVKTVRNNGAPTEVIQAVINSRDIGEAYKNAGAWTAGGSGMVGEYNYYRAQALANGQQPIDFQTYQNIDANRKRSIAAAAVETSGMTPKQTQNFLSITSKFQADSLINNAIKGQTAIAIADQVLANPNSAANQLKSLYVLVKNLDPDSAVREGEISLADKTQSFMSRFSNTLARISEGRVVSPDAAKQLAIATKELASAWDSTAKLREKQYKAQAYGVGISDAFNEYLKSSDMSYSVKDEIVNDENSAKSSVIEYGTSNPNYQNQIRQMVNDGVPFLTIKQVLGI